MTIDERLEKLAERHEALAQTVELMAAEQREAARRTDERFAQLATAMTQLVEVVRRHEERLDRLEVGT